MKKFFLHDGTAPSGPFDLGDLKTKTLTKQTPVWYEGLNEWTTIEKVPELQSLFASEPPPFQKPIAAHPENIYNDTPPSYYLGKPKKKSSYRTLAIIIVLLVLALTGKLVYDQIEHQNTVAARENIINAEEDAKKEARDHITSYVTAGLSDYLFNSLGGIKNLSVKVNNNTAYIIDEVQVKLFYYKPNGTVWNTRIVTFNLLNPETTNTIKVPDTDRGVKVDKEIVSIKSRVLGLQ